MSQRQDTSIQLGIGDRFTWSDTDARALKARLLSALEKRSKFAPAQWHAALHTQLQTAPDTVDCIALWLWFELRVAVATHAYVACTDVAPLTTDEITTSARFGTGPSLVLSRSGDGRTARIQVGTLACDFSLRALVAITLAVWVPARDSGGYQLALLLHDPAVSPGGDQLDHAWVQVPVSYALPVTLDLLKTAAHIASFLGVRFSYQKGADV
ncbi:MAG: hypothetical protein RL701_1411 [Pseudomonadota bacterium]|jgi:hypothetical protein